MALPEKNNTIKRYTYKDYLAWPDDERRELINGTAWDISPAPSVEHQRISRDLLTIFNIYLKDKPCEVFQAAVDVRLAEHDMDDELAETVVQPDIFVVCDKSKIDQKGVQGAPDLIIEIISPFTAGKDMKEKFYIYEHYGVKEYWIVFPIEKTVMVFRLTGNGTYGKPETYISTDTIRVGLFNDLDIDLSEIFVQ